jgi:predicted aspartyl protease
MVRRLRKLGAFLSLVLLAGAARADDACQPLTLITSVSLMPAPDNTWQFAPVTIDGHKKFMLVDTGGFMSEITPQAADELQLPRRHANFRQTNVAGESSDQVAVASTFTLGRLTAQSIEFVVAPEKALFGGITALAGIIGPNILRNYDVDLDFGAHKLSLISPDHCEGKVVYWQADALAIVPMHVLADGHIVLPVTLDGHKETALLDTGASGSTITTRVAERDFDLKPGSADTPYVAGMRERPSAATYRHTFASLSFGDVAASNPHFEIIPDLNRAREPDIGTRFAGEESGTPPMLLGMNILRHLHIYIAYKEQKLYISPADATAAAPASPAAPHLPTTH